MAPPVVTPSGADTIALLVSEDAWQGDAQFTVAIDGKTVGGVQTATASHAAGATNAISVSGNWGAGAHTVGITFINDAWGGTAQTDRNLYVSQATYDGGKSLGAPASLFANGTTTFNSPAATPAAKATALDVKLSEDAWLGDAQYSLTIDGKPVGTNGTVTASHALGKSQDVTLSAALAAGTHDLGVTFLNDAWGGTAATDRNLFVSSVAVNGSAVAGSAASLWSNTTSHIQFLVPAA